MELDSEKWFEDQDCVEYGLGIGEWRGFHLVKRVVKPELADFFKLNRGSRHTLQYLESLVKAYINDHKGFSDKLVNYDDALWKLFGISENKTLKDFQIKCYLDSLTTSAEPFNFEMRMKLEIWHTW